MLAVGSTKEKNASKTENTEPSLSFLQIEYKRIALKAWINDAKMAKEVVKVPNKSRIPNILISPICIHQVRKNDLG